MAAFAREMVNRMQLYHDSRDSAYRAPSGAQPCCSEVRLRLRVSGGQPDQVYLRAWFGKEAFYPMRCVDATERLYEAILCLPGTPCLLWYDFQAWQAGQFYWYGNAEDGLGGVGAPVYGNARSFQITVYDPDFKSPDWVDSAVFYQIFPDRFSRGNSPVPPPLPKGRTFHLDFSEKPDLVVNAETGDNAAHDFFGGTLDGIREKLPYLQTLGVTGLYLNPIFLSDTNHRFNTSDWETIDPLLGAASDFRRLCAEALRFGIRVVLDGVFSHAGSDSRFFKHASAVSDSPYRSWFTFVNWPSVYKSWWGFATLPEMNKHDPAVNRYFLTGDRAIVKRWVREGASGWRIDVADELPMPYLRQMRASAREARADALLIGEVWEDASNKVAYGEMRSYCLGDTLDGVMNYPLRDEAVAFLTGSTDAYRFKRRMDSLYENYPPPFARALLNVLGSHDRARILSVLAGVDGLDLPREERAELRLTDAQRELGAERLKLMLALVAVMPGIPCVYYGDEAGVEGSADPYNRGTFPWGREDKALTAYFIQVLGRRKTVSPLARGSLAIEALSGDVVAIIRTAGMETARTVIDRSALTADFWVGPADNTDIPAVHDDRWETDAD